MSPKYTSLEDGQVIVTDEPREDLEGLARWVRSDDDGSGSTETPASLQPSGAVLAAGPVNLDPVSGSVDGAPAVVSASAGIANPADTLTPEQAQEAAANSFAAANAGEGTENVTGTVPTDGELSQGTPATVELSDGTVIGGDTIGTLPAFQVLKFAKGDPDAKGEPIEETFTTYEEASTFADEHSAADPAFSYTAVPPKPEAPALG